jgi:ATP phosphoribosyltransferase
MSAKLTLALPSKGRLKEQTEAWLADCGLGLDMEGGARGYRASLRGVAGVDVRLLSAADIAQALDAGDVHLGVTGEDLLREQGEEMDRRLMLLRPLGFGRADVVVAAPQSWIDVDSMADVDDVAHDYLARTGSPLRVATKYEAQTRAFFAAHGIADYRIVESLGATEGAPAAGAAELIVDITTTGTTLAANNLKVIGDGVILKSQAQLAAALTTEWTKGQLDQVRRFLSIVEARARARNLGALRWPTEQNAAAEKAVKPYLGKGASLRADGLLVPMSDLFAVSAALSGAGVGPVSVTRPDYVFEPACAPADALAARLGL